MPRNTFYRQFLPEGGFVDWLSTADIQRETGMGKGNISSCCVGRRPSAYGFEWKRMEGEPERLFNPDKDDRALVMPRKTFYRQFLPEGGYFDWQSPADVERETGMKAGYVSDCSSGRLPSAYGFKWKLMAGEAERLFNPDKDDRALVMPRKTFCRQFLPEGGYVDWQSPSDVERETGMGGKGIARCLSGGRLSAYGFKWKRMEGEPERLFNPAKMDRALVMPRK